MELLIVGLGGALGSLARYELGKIITLKSGTHLPLATFAINITGAILLGIVCGAGASGNLALLLADGFLGAYTTFSTFMYEGFALFREKKLDAAVYIAASLILGIGGFSAGYALVTLL
jgi:CrcB protein